MLVLFRLASKRITMHKNVKHGVALILGICAMSMTFNGMRGYSEFPISKIRIEGELTQSERLILRKTVERVLQVDVSPSPRTIVYELLQLGWIGTVRVRKSWPDSIDVFVERETIVARWGNQSYLTQAGKVVEIGEVRMIDLPILRGSASDSETAMQLYRTIARASGKLGLQLRALTESSLGYWTVSFENGINIELGASDILGRVDRFLAVYERVIKGNEHAALYIDARYNNGIAVQWNHAERNLLGIGQRSTGDT